MTGRWLTLSAAAALIGKATGKPVSIEGVRDLHRCGYLTVSFLYEDHHVVLEESLTTYLDSLSASECAASGEVVAVHADKPTDTPNDEGERD
jgi:hypothetical protein